MQICIHIPLLTNISRTAFLSTQIDRPEIAPLMLTGHTKEVTAVAWCPSDMTKIATCSDDSDLRLWRVAHGKKGPGEIIGRCQQYTGYGKDACMYFQCGYAVFHTKPWLLR